MKPCGIFTCCLYPSHTVSFHQSITNAEWFDNRKRKKSFKINKLYVHPNFIMVNFLFSPWQYSFHSHFYRVKTLYLILNHCRHTASGRQPQSPKFYTFGERCFINVTKVSMAVTTLKHIHFLGGKLLTVWIFIRETQNRPNIVISIEPFYFLVLGKQTQVNCVNFLCK